MKISEQFAGNYLKAQDLPQPKLFTIESCNLVAMPEGDKKPALKFFNEQQQLVLNKTNAFCLSEGLGDDTTRWVGQPIELYATQTSFSGRMVPCIRVRLPQQRPAAVPQVAQQTIQLMTPAPQPAPATQQTMQPASVPQPAAVPVQQMPLQAPAADYPIDA